MQQLGDIALLVCAALGLLISLYFTLVRYMVIPADSKLIPAFCRLDENTCQLVIHHPDACLLGVPNSILGIAFYALVFLFVFDASMIPLGQTLMYVSWLTVGLASYLVYSLYVRIKVTCSLCLISHSLNVVIAAILTFRLSF